jgi:cytoskeleton protein RodZ
MQSVRSASQQTDAPAAREVPLEPQISTPSSEGPNAQSTEGATAVNTNAGGPAGQQGAGAATQPSSAPPATGSAGTEASAPVRGKPIEVTLRFAADSWVEIYDANGERLFYDIGSADSERTVSGTPPLRVTFGNAPGVTLDVNGKPATVPANVVRDDTAHFTINRSGRIVRTREVQAP